VKKVRITLNKDSLIKKIPVFNSPESLYVWLNDPELQAQERLDPTLGSTINLKKGETMEIEWMGCEFIKEDSYIFRIDEIRLAKTIIVPSLKKSNLVGVHNGWINEEIISFKSGTKSGIKRTRLTQKSKHEFNIEELFSSRGLQEKDSDHAVEPQDLH